MNTIIQSIHAPKYGFKLNVVQISDIHFEIYKVNLFDETDRHLIYWCTLDDRATSFAAGYIFGYTDSQDENRQLNNSRLEQGAVGQVVVANTN